jgi:hypothetical protein
MKVRSKKLDKRFFELQPQIEEVAKYGLYFKPSLYDIIEYYYSSNGIDIKKAKYFAKKYIEEWVRLEGQYQARMLPLSVFLERIGKGAK